MKLSRLVAAAFALPLALFAFAARAEIKIVASVPDLAALAKEVGGAQVSVKTLSLPTQDPHFIDAKPSLALELNRADVLLLVGLDLEIGWLPTLLVGARNPHIQTGSTGYLDCSQFVHKLDLPTGSVDRSHGDIHPAGNPHYLHDPRAAAAVVQGMAARLGEIDPGHRAVYAANRDAFLARLATARAGWEKRMAPHRGAPIVAYHKTWSYVLDWLGLEAVDYLEPKPGIPPNPQHVANLINVARARKVHVILQESYYPDAASRLVADKIPAELVRVPGGTNFAAGESYVQHIDAMIDALAKAFEKAK
jgi:zinc/manganese transport system substrate-binding protein